MKTKRMIKWVFALGLLLALATLLPRSARADQPDVIGQYAVHVMPQDDGTLVMEYRFSDYCATTDFPGDKPYLQVGVPNRNFDLVDWGPKSAPDSQTKVWVTSADTLRGLTSQVQLNFNKQPLAGECWRFNFTINQTQMAYAQGSDEVTFQFTPGSFDFAKINALTVTWDLPTDTSLVHKVDPEPTRGQNQAVWTDSDLAPNQEFTVNITYAKSAFPNLAAVPAGQPNPPSSSESQDQSALVCAIVLVVILLIVAVRFWGLWASDGGYGSGLGGAFYTGFGGGSSSSGGGGRTGGGGGGFAGRGSSCACAACACACACAGGGRAGCTRKGFDISRLIRKGTTTIV